MRSIGCHFSFVARNTLPSDEEPNLRWEIFIPVCPSSVYLLYYSTLFDVACFEEFAIDEVALVVPLLTETTDEWLTKETVEWKLEAFAQFECRTAYVPFMIVECGYSGYGTDTDGVEGTGDGLLPAETTLAEGAVDSAEGTTWTTCLATVWRNVSITNEDTVLTIDDGGNEFAVTIGIDAPLLLYLCLGFGCEAVPDDVFGVLKFGDFIEGYRCTGITFDMP